MSAKLIVLLIGSGLITYGLRAVPFLWLGKKEELSPRMKYIGETLPRAVMATLVVYCLMNSFNFNIADNYPMWLASLVTVLVHLKYRNAISSITFGTLAYMILIRL